MRALFFNIDCRNSKRYVIGCSCGITLLSLLWRLVKRNLDKIHLIGILWLYGSFLRKSNINWKYYFIQRLFSIIENRSRPCCLSNKKMQYLQLKILLFVSRSIFARARKRKKKEWNSICQWQNWKLLSGEKVVLESRQRQQIIDLIFRLRDRLERGKKKKIINK